MSDASAPTPDRMSHIVAEEILRLLYGDDFEGCPVGLDQIAGLIHGALTLRAEEDRKIHELYEAVISAAHQLSTPPDPQKISTPEQLQQLLGDRLDAIHTITSKTLVATSEIKSKRAGDL